MPQNSVRERHHRPYGGHSGDAGIEFGKDNDHILYSSSFRRLGGVTQVVGVKEETPIFHNRMTHSLKVAQVGRRLTRELLDKIRPHDGALWGAIESYGGHLDAKVVHAACLAHDLGRPPFGRVAEKALQKLLTGNPDASDRSPQHRVFPRVVDGVELADSFQNSAQTFRIVNKLAFRESYADGKSAALNLSRATLAALLRYPWSRSEYFDFAREGRRDGEREKWGYYDSEHRLFDFVSGLIVDREVTLLNGETRTERRTIEAQVVDWADDISYAIHDVEDFFRAQLIPLHALVWSDESLQHFFDYAWPRVEGMFVSPSASEPERDRVRDEARRYLEEARVNLPSRPFTGTRQDREDLHVFASRIIRSAVAGTELTEQGLVRPARRDRMIVEIFKQLTERYVVNGLAFASSQRGQIHMIRQLFRGLTSWVRDEYPRSEEPNDSLPARLREYVRIALDADPEVGCVSYSTDEHKIRRAVVDYICTLTERQAVRLASLLRGAEPQPLLGDYSYT